MTRCRRVTDLACVAYLAAARDLLGEERDGCRDVFRFRWPLPVRFVAPYRRRAADLELD